MTPNVPVPSSVVMYPYSSLLWGTSAVTHVLVPPSPMTSYEIVAEATLYPWYVFTGRSEPKMKAVSEPSMTLVP